MQKSIVFLGLFIVANALSLSHRTEGSDVDRYSACYPDRGYTKDDALKAGNFLWQNATFENGLKMKKRDCIYKLVDTTIVSLCNGEARDRTVNKDEVRRGIEQLTQDCGAGGTFNGVHVVNNLTFAAFGVTGSKAIVIPPGSPDPDLPGGVTTPKINRILKPRNTRVLGRQDDDPCTTIAFNGVPRFDCKHVNYMAPDGSCPGDLNTGNECALYCEVRRTGFIGIESTAPGEWGKLKPAGQPFELAEGVEHSVTNGFSIGIEGTFRDIIGASLSYEYSTTITTTKSSTTINEPSDTYMGRWVVFPQFIESCGSVTRRAYVPAEVPLPCGPGCIPVTPPAKCEGPIETLGNICTYSPYILDGKAQSVWVWRWEKDGVPVKLENQSNQYKSLCTSKNPDGDPDEECLAPAFV